MCSSYTRNLRLFLSPADVEFLQPSPDQPSEVVSLLLPQWIRNPNTFFFYLLQQLSLMFLQPQYTQVVDNKERVLLKTPSELSKVLMQYNLPLSLEQDYLFLYIRPVSKGRGEREGEREGGREGKVKSRILRLVYKSIQRLMLQVYKDILSYTDLFSQVWPSYLLV